MSERDGTDATAPTVRRARTAATIYDVAKLAGVAPSTVSRALGKPGRINVRTEERIRAAAAELNYRLNPMARALPTGRTSTLGLVMADITNPTFFPAIRGAERAAAAAGVTVILAESQESGALEAEVAQRIAPSTDGLVLVSSRLDDAEIVALAVSVPVVVMNREVAGVPSIVPDLGPGIDDALDHLAGLGHTAIAYLPGPASSWMSAARGERLRAGAATRGMTLTELAPAAPTLDGGTDALDRVAGAGVTAVVAYNDLVAIGLLRALQASGRAVPAELSVLGFDDIFGSDFTSPPLSTVRSPLGRMGERAVRRLLGHDDDGDGDDADDDALPTEFVPRGSTGPVALATG